jgi:S-adenosylmethionine hydrolase
MLVLFTDFGSYSPYVGLMKQALLRYAPSVPVIDLLHDVPPFDIQGAAYLLATYSLEFPRDSIFVAVVDPGVGSPRDGLILQADNRWFIGPDNGLFDRIVARADYIKAWHIFWRSARLSATFHGRDVFAPVAAMLAEGTATPDQLGDPFDYKLREWPDELARVIYIDHYGNAITGIRAASMGSATIMLHGQPLTKATTFSDLPIGEGFFYENSSGLVEIAVNQGNATVQFGLAVGHVVEVNGCPLTEIRPR